MGFTINSKNPFSIQLLYFKGFNDIKFYIYFPCHVLCPLLICIIIFTNNFNVGATGEDSGSLEPEGSSSEDHEHVVLIHNTSHGAVQRLFWDYFQLRMNPHVGPWSKKSHLSSKTSRQDETITHPAEDAMTAWRDDTTLKRQKQGVLHHLSVVLVL